MSTTLRRTQLLVVTAALGLTLSACGSYGSSSTTDTGSQAASNTGAKITISGFAFSVLTVKAGTTVSVTNKDAAAHTLKVQGTDIDVTVNPGGTDTFVAPSKAGTYTLICDFHLAMKGTLVVT